MCDFCLGRITLTQIDSVEILFVTAPDHYHQRLSLSQGPAIYIYISAARVCSRVRSKYRRGTASYEQLGICWKLT